MNKKAFKRALITFGAYFALLCGYSTNSVAGIGLGQTRIVYHQADASQSISLHNSGDSVFLVQARVSDWGADKAADNFTVLPPLFRLEPQSDSVLRVIRTGDGLPKDRESIFHFRINAIEGRGKALPEVSGSNSGVAASLGISLGFSIKLFYRPSTLSMPVAQAYKMLTFSKEGQVLKVSNPTPYYLTFASLSVGGKTVDLSKDSASSMLSPFGQGQLALAGGTAGDKVAWTLIDDYGVETAVQKGALH